MNDTKSGKGTAPEPEETGSHTPEPEAATATSLDAELPPPAQANETGGPKGPEPTRFGDWERKGRCIDF